MTVNLKDVNESPAFTTPSKDQDTLYIDENVTGDALTLRTSEADAGDTSDDPVAYAATDNDNTRTTDDCRRHNLQRGGC